MPIFPDTIIRADEQHDRAGVDGRQREHDGGGDFPLVFTGPEATAHVPHHHAAIVPERTIAIDLRTRQQRAHPAEAVAEVHKHTLHGGKKLDDVLQRRDAGRLLDLAQQKSGRAVHGRQCGPPLGGRRTDEQFARLTVEKALQPLRRFEKVERLPRGRGVHDYEVIGAFLDQRGQGVERHILMRAGESARQPLIKAVRQDTPADFRRRRIAGDGRVPGALLIDEQSGQRPAR